MNNVFTVESKIIRSPSLLLQENNKFIYKEAKESIIKAVKAAGFKNPIPFKEIEILSSDSGAPKVDLHFVKINFYNFQLDQFSLKLLLVLENYH